MKKYLSAPRNVPFDRIFLDPNNPRVAPTARPGYESPDVLFNEDEQEQLEKTLEAIYDDYEELKEAIIIQGWVPVDAIIVWEHPKKKGWFVVVEGNTRTLTLRKIRRELVQDQARLAALNAAKRLSAAQKESKAALEERVENIESIIEDTDNLNVYPVNAETVEELLEILPRLLGVRHITHAQQWKPFPQGLYILSLYEDLFEQEHGEDAKFFLDQRLVKLVAQAVSQDERKTRKNIQSAYAFRHFEEEYGERIKETGSPLKPGDHYFFSLILDNRYAADQFRFGKDDHRLPNKMEEVLFKWAFSKPRDGDENENVLYKAENIRLWNTMKTFDNKHKTNFAAQLDVEKPDEVPPGGIRQLELEYLQRKASKSPIEVIASLIAALEELKVPSLQSQASHLKPMLEVMVEQGKGYLRMIEAVTSGDGNTKDGKAEAPAKPPAEPRRRGD